MNTTYTVLTTNEDLKVVDKLGNDYSDLIDDVADAQTAGQFKITFEIPESEEVDFELFESALEENDEVISYDSYESDPDDDYF